MPLLIGDGLLGLALLTLWIFCIVDVIRTAEIDMRSLPKLMWLLIVLFLPDIGSILWLCLGRPTGPAAAHEPRHGHMNSFPEYDRPGRFAATSAEDDEEFLRAIRDRAEAQRKRAAEQRRIAEQREADERRRESPGDAPSV
ncbi:MAG: hypothetical protein JWM93_2758 [Frankiales bacterium]|nr:hypothetical protein [Frankiales bacterium]